MTVQQRRKVWKKKQPVAVTIVAWGIVLLFLARLYQVAQPLLRMNLLQDGIHDPLLHGLRLTPIGTAVAVSAWYLLQALGGIVALIGFLRVRRWAWVMLMAWTAGSLCVSLISYFYGRSNFIVMASDVIIAVALSQSEVQRIFGVKWDGNHEPAR